MKASATAHSNIALVKYWGRANLLNIPLNDNIGMTKCGTGSVRLEARTTVEFSEDYGTDSAAVGGKRLEGRELERVLEVVNPLRKAAGVGLPFRMESKNDFPTAAGLASSAAGFAALVLAASKALNLDMTPEQLSTYARLGSGSAARSLHGGFVYWHAGDSHETSYAEQICGPKDFGMGAVIALVSEGRKDVSSDAGHESAATSPFNDVRIGRSRELARKMRAAILDDDFTAVGKMAEESCVQMHAVMMTSQPALFYWLPATLAVLKAVRKARESGLECYFSIDAGPNVHCFCRPEKMQELQEILQGIEGVKKTIPALPAENPASAAEHLF